MSGGVVVSHSGWNGIFAGYAARASAGLLAAGGIMAGKYVIFVYAVKKTFGAELGRMECPSATSTRAR